MHNARWIVLVWLALVSTAWARVEERFRIDLEGRTIEVREGDGFVPLLGVEPMVGSEDMEGAVEAAVLFLSDLTGEQEPRLAHGSTPRTEGAVIATLPDGRVLNEELLREGYAKALTHLVYPERWRYVQLETEARTEHRGLWSYFEPREAAAGEEPPERHQVYRVFFATDRKATGASEPNDWFGPERGDGGLAYGACDVSIPRDHEMGQVERPSIWRLEFRENPDEHVVLLAVRPEPKEAFFGELGQSVAKSLHGEALVFVHGYNVEFAEAARRTAQLAYDLAFDGAPILYSWPSRGSLLSYAADCATADWSAEHLRSFLQDVRARSGATTIHLIAHSMGNRVLTQALRLLAESGASTRFNQVVLAAPDIDAQMFRDQIAPKILGVAERVTLYASSEDEALKESKRLHVAPRAGDSGAGILVVAGMDTIDVSAVDTSFLGHSYFGDNVSVISDLFWLLRERKAPAERTWLTAMPLGQLRYWVFGG